MGRDLRVGGGKKMGRLRIRRQRRGKKRKMGFERGRMIKWYK